MKKRIVIHLDSTVSKGHENIINWLSNLPADNRGIRYKDEIVELLNAAILGNPCAPKTPIASPSDHNDTDEIVFLEDDLSLENKTFEAQVEPPSQPTVQPMVQPTIQPKEQSQPLASPDVVVDTQPLKPKEHVASPAPTQAPIPPKKSDKRLFKAKMKALEF